MIYDGSFILDDLLVLFPLFASGLVADLVADHTVALKGASFCFHLYLVELMGGGGRHVALEDVKLMGLYDEHIVSLNFLVVYIAIETQRDAVESQKVDNILFLCISICCVEDHSASEDDAFNHA